MCTHPGQRWTWGSLFYILLNHWVSVRAILLTARFHMTEENKLSLGFRVHFDSTMWSKSSPYTPRALSLAEALFCSWYCVLHICGFHLVAVKWTVRWIDEWMDSSATKFHVFISVRNYQLPMVLVSLWVPHHLLARYFSFCHGQTIYSQKTDSAKLAFCSAGMAQ